MFQQKPAHAKTRSVFSNRFSFKCIQNHSTILPGINMPPRQNPISFYDMICIILSSNTTPAGKVSNFLLSKETLHNTNIGNCTQTCNCYVTENMPRITLVHFVQTHYTLTDIATHCPIIKCDFLLLKTSSAHSCMIESKFSFTNSLATHKFLVSCQLRCHKQKAKAII